MANIASNRITIIGAQEDILAAIEVLGEISHCGDANILCKSDDGIEYDMEFFSRWGEPLETLLELSGKYGLEFDGYTREHGTGYYSQWLINYGEIISRHYCSIDRNNYEYTRNEDDEYVCPFCGEDGTFSPNRFETGYDFICDIWVCDNCGEEDATCHELQKIEGTDEFVITIAPKE